MSRGILMILANVATEDEAELNRKPISPVAPVAE